MEILQGGEERVICRGGGGDDLDGKGGGVVVGYFGEGWMGEVKAGG